MKIRNWFFTLVVVCAGVASCGKKEFAAVQVNAIVPHPASVEIEDNGAFLLDRSAAVVYEGEGAQNSAAFLKEYLKQHYDLSAGKWGRRKIVLKVAEDTSAVDGAYSLEVLPHRINIQGKNPAGLFYGVQTLIQLLPVEDTVGKKILVPAVRIEDAPAFSYRGMHLDVARHFMPVWFVKKYIDYLALHKLNYFHWHLTDDQGWRIESKKHPRLNEVGAYREGTIIGLYPGTGVDSTRYGGYYTVEEMKEIEEKLEHTPPSKSWGPNRDAVSPGKQEMSNQEIAKGRKKQEDFLDYLFQEMALKEPMDPLETQKNWEDIWKRLNEAWGARHMIRRRAQQAPRAPRPFSRSFWGF